MGGWRGAYSDVRDPDGAREHGFGCLDERWSWDTVYRTGPVFI